MPSAFLTPLDKTDDHTPETAELAAMLGLVEA